MVDSSEKETRRYRPLHSQYENQDGYPDLKPLSPCALLLSVLLVLPTFGIDVVVVIWRSIGRRSTRIGEAVSLGRCIETNEISIIMVMRSRAASSQRMPSTCCSVKGRCRCRCLLANIPGCCCLFGEEEKGHCSLGVYQGRGARDIISLLSNGPV